MFQKLEKLTNMISNAHAKVIFPKKGIFTKLEGVKCTGGGQVSCYKISLQKGDYPLLKNTKLRE